MEAIFIKRVYALTAQILGNEIDLNVALESLNGYLEHAKRLKMQRYEAETLNTLGILYGIIGNIPKQMYYFKSAYEYTELYDDDDHDFVMKTTNNLGVGYYSSWQLEEAKNIFERGITIIDQYDIHTLVAIYIYSNMIELYMIDGDFEKADTCFERAWLIAQQVKMKDYSRMEFFIIVTSLHHQKAQIDIALGNCEAVNERLALASEQIEKTSHKILHQANDLIRMYHALICEKDEIKAKTYEDDLLAQLGGSFSTDKALETSIFLKHNHQPEWAKRYVSMVLDTPNDDDDPILTTMKRYAIDILKG